MPGQSFQLSIEPWIKYDDEFVDLAHEVDKALAVQRQLLQENQQAMLSAEERVIGLMRSSYMFAYGLSRVFGSGFSQYFFSLHSIAFQTVSAYKAIAAAKMATGTPWEMVQAGIMITSLGAALISLLASGGQTKDLARRMRGLSTSLAGLSGLLRYGIGRR